MKKLLITSAILIGSVAALSAQSRPADSVRRTALPSAFAGNTQRAPAKPRPYKTVITDKAVTRRGLIKIHNIEDKYYFEIGDSILNREILVVSRISRAGAEMRAADSYAGDVIGQTVIRFEKGPSDRIFMRKISYRTYSPDSTKSMYQAVQRSNIQAIAAAFNIAAYSPDKKGSVIDMTDFINGDNDIFFFGSPQAKTTRPLRRPAGRQELHPKHPHVC